MPDNSCRSCGGDLIKHSKCSECKKTIQKICIACNLKTHEEFHTRCMNLVQYQINTKKTHTTSQSIIYKKSEKINKNHLLKIFKISGLIVMVLTGLGFANYIVPSLSLSSHLVSNNDKISSINLDHVTQNVIPTPNSAIDVKPNNSFKAQYVNCLGTSDGTSLTINCPTDYGLVYKAIVEIPNDLMLQFEGKVFHMRNFSVLEISNHLLITYQKQTYVTTFVAN